MLWASWHQTRYEEIRLKALVAFYPSCGDMPRLRTSIPLLMLLGAEDNWTPAEPCRLLAQEARREGHPVFDRTYPDAHHGFDGSHIQRRTTIADARRGQGATVEYNPAAHADAERQLRRFLREYLRS